MDDRRASSMIWIRTTLALLLLAAVALGGVPPQAQAGRVMALAQQHDDLSSIRTCTRLHIPCCACCHFLTTHRWDYFRIPPKSSRSDLSIGTLFSLIVRADVEL